MTVSAAAAFEISQLIYATWELIDTADGIGVDEHFLPDGTLAFGTVVHTGREEIRAVYAGRSGRGPRTARHLVTNPIFSAKDGVITVRYQMTLYAADGIPPLPTTPPLGVIDIVDRAVIDGGRPLLMSRQLINVFKSATEDFAVAFLDAKPREIAAEA